MKKLLFIPFFFLPFITSAQLNDRFYTAVGTFLTPTAAQAGAYASNIFVTWRQVQQSPSSSVYDWSSVDKLVEDNQSVGLRTMITLKCTHPMNADDATAGSCAYIYDQGTTDDNSSWPVIGADTVEWKNFVDSFVERYDGDGINDMPGLTYPISQWHIVGEEWPRTWCSQYPAGSVETTNAFVQLVNMTYQAIKTKQPTDTISLTGFSSGYQEYAFYDGYFPGGANGSICYNSNCTPNSEVELTHVQLAADPSFLAARSNAIYIFQHAAYDELDLHSYGRWQEIPNCVQWAHDSTFGKPIVFMEGDGPFCYACEDVYNPANDVTVDYPDTLARDRASYIVYEFITGLASGVKKLNHGLATQTYVPAHLQTVDPSLSNPANDKDPAYATFKFLATIVFSNADADTVVRIAETNPALYHYQIQPLAMDVVWSTNTNDTYVVNGAGSLNRWDIPTTCSFTGTAVCDTNVVQSSINVNSSYTIQLTNNVPVFYSWNNIILPVTMLSFTAKKENATVKLNWATAQEINNKEFIIQRSADGLQFNAIGNVIAQSNNSGAIQYNFIDGQPLIGNNYYRLQQVNKDGSFNYSKVVKINFSNKQLITISPNPATSIINISVTDISKTYTIQLTDMNGKLIRRQLLEQGNQTTSMPVNDIAKGTYELKVISTNGEDINEVVIQ